MLELCSGLNDLFTNLNGVDQGASKNLRLVQDFQKKEMATMKDIVLVHAGFVDGAGWEGVYAILKKEVTTSALSRTRRSRWRTT